MTLNENADIDTSQVTDARGRGGGGGLAGIPIPIGGGLLGTLLAIGLVVAGSFFGPQLFGGGGGDDLAQVCASSNPDRFERTDCRNIVYINSIQAYWTKAAPTTFGEPYQATDTVFFDSFVNTGCGQADSGVGPFYCPADNLVYIDLTFYQELATRFGADGEFAQAYVLAHEYGHHLQNLTGIAADVNRQQQRDPGAANELSVRMELQADCLAGVWAKNATETTDASGRPLFDQLTQADIDQALEAAAAIGDDRIQEQTQGRIDESKFTHGTAQQRQTWFSNGYTSGDGKRCDTFSGAV